jgi:hypothetical protein
LHHDTASPPSVTAKAMTGKRQKPLPGPFPQQFARIAFNVLKVKKFLRQKNAGKTDVFL